ncbi:MAG TPA: D-alanyl-D-alanine carboxypeptidase [Candidatus Faecousia excrementigallinarum]|uniref:serine-type D-Ala-D-Ala carboxypeptidase n=1 Tax=Candidatus Faecousia excrementigallinarum TaxID=2840806 RepID=A0A9D0Z1G1_9FIRM|nr:D-alanyl-D-alanine carboxypeptidase [Candidatus Faecousia excrementigallinarum]
MAVGILAAILFLPVKAGAISAECAILIDAQTGRVLYEKKAEEKSLIASTTKIMTALVICEQTNVLDRVKIPKEAVGIEGSSMYLKEGEVLTVQELLYGLMLQSGNDAAVALAIYCGGTVEGFTELMNDKAHRLGMTQSHFANPNGLDSPGNYSTARDMAILTAYAMQNPIFAQTVSTKTITIGERCLRNHNKLLWQLEGANGVKTGYTKAAGRILISSVTRMGRQLIAVTFNDPNDWQDHKDLIEDGFSRFTVQKLIHQGQTLGQLELAGGQEASVDLIAAEDFSYSLAQGERVTISLPEAGFAYAPVAEGQEAGFAHILVDGTAVAKVPLVYGKTIERAD